MPNFSLLEYKNYELHPLIHNDTWSLSHKEVSLALDATIDKIIVFLDKLSEYKHYSYEEVEYAPEKRTSSILFFTKSGLVRLAYFLKTDEALEFLEFIEDLNLSQAKDTSGHKFYKEIENVLNDRLIKLKNDPDASLEEINHFIITLDNMIKKRDSNLPVQKNSGPANMTDILETVIGLAQSYAVKK